MMTSNLMQLNTEAPMNYLPRNRSVDARTKTVSERIRDINFVDMRTELAADVDVRTSRRL